MLGEVQGDEVCPVLPAITSAAYDTQTPGLVVITGLPFVQPNIRVKVFFLGPVQTAKQDPCLSDHDGHPTLKSPEITTPVTGIT